MFLFTTQVHVSGSHTPSRVKRGVYTNFRVHSTPEIYTPRRPTIADISDIQSQYHEKPVLFTITIVITSTLRPIHLDGAYDMAGGNYPLI